MKKNVSFFGKSGYNHKKMIENDTDQEKDRMEVFI